MGNASVIGSEKKELLITVDRTAMEYYGVSPGAVLSVVKAQNLDIPAGDIRQSARQLSVRLVGEFSGVQDVRNLRVPTIGGGNVRLSEIGEVAL